jgi:hypothetical protein
MKRKEIRPEKLRDMVRSILPSRHRTGPRAEKAYRKRKHRRAIRAELRLEDAEVTAVDFLRDVKVTDIVNWRRGGDKLAHFMRWCEKITAGLSKEEALGFVRSILPKSLIGDHAYAHWRDHVKYRGRRYVRWTEIKRRREQSWADSASFRLRRALEVDPTLHARLNAAIKSARMFDEDRRLLGGLHDVQRFAVDVRPRDPDPHLPERVILLRLIAETERAADRPPFDVLAKPVTRSLPGSLRARRSLPGLLAALRRVCFRSALRDR